MSWPSIELVVFKDRVSVYSIEGDHGTSYCCSVEISIDLSMGGERAQKRRPPHGRG